MRLEDKILDLEGNELYVDSIISSIQKLMRAVVAKLNIPGASEQEIMSASISVANVTQVIDSCLAEAPRLLTNRGAIILAIKRADMNTNDDVLLADDIYRKISPQEGEIELTEAESAFVLKSIVSMSKVEMPNEAKIHLRRLLSPSK